MSINDRADRGKVVTTRWRSAKLQAAVAQRVPDFVTNLSLHRSTALILISSFTLFTSNDKPKANSLSQLVERFNSTSKETDHG